MPKSVREVTVSQVVERLTRRFPESSVGRVSAIVAEEYDLLASNPIRVYVPNLVEHEARERLRMGDDLSVIGRYAR
jgi:hypothetical protein